MKYKFTVEYVLKGKPTGIVVRQPEEYNIQLGNSPTLGGCPIKRSISQPRALRKDGSPDLDIFCFYLENGNDREKFIKGEIVELEP
jgi:hypothetical protein